jgi:hypothetical protein
MTPAIYRLHFPLKTRLWLVLPFVVICVAMGVLFFLAPDMKHGGPPFPIYFVPLVLAVVFGIQIGWTPFEIRVESSGHLEIKSLARMQRIHSSEIRSIRVEGAQPSHVLIVHDGGRIRLWNAITGFHRLLSELEKAHPHIEILGC